MSRGLAQRLQRNHDHRSEEVQGCHYTTFPYRSLLSADTFHIYMDFEHDGLNHASWKESSDQRKTIVQHSKKLIVKKKTNKEKNLSQNELIEYFRTHRLKDDRFIFDRLIGMSRRPRNVLYIDFYRNEISARSTKERTLFHYKYLLPHCIRMETMNDMINDADEAQLDLQIIGHFILNPSQLSKEEIDMYQLISDYGDLYEGYVLRIDHEDSHQQRYILLLSSTFHADMKLTLKTSMINDPAHLDARIDPKSTIERLVLEHVRQYFNQHFDRSIDEIRRIRMEFESDRMMIYLYDEEEMIDQFPLDISRQQAIDHFGVDQEENFYFLSGMNEESLLSDIEHQLKNRSISMENLKKIFQAYADRRLTIYAREECMRIGLEYRFHDIFDQLDQINDQNQQNEFIQRMIDELPERWAKHREQRLRAEATAKILLFGPSTDNMEISSKRNGVVVLDHHRETYIVQPENDPRSTKLKDLQRFESGIIVHQPVSNGPDSFHRLPMTIDSLTTLKRREQRKQLDLQNQEDEILTMGSGLHRLVTFDLQLNSQHSIRCQEDERSEATKTNTTSSFNTSAHIEEKIKRKFESDARPNKKRTFRSLAEHEKHRARRKRHRNTDSTMDLGQKYHPPLLDRLLLLRHQKNNNQSSMNSSLSEVSQSQSDQSDSNEMISEEEMTDEEFLRSLYGPLTNEHQEINASTMDHPSVVKAIRNLSQIFIHFLYLHKSVADELAETILNSRKHLSASITTVRSYDVTRNSIVSRKPLPIMHRMVEYLSHVDWRIFHYITKEFLPHGTRITNHALEFSSALLSDLIEESVFETYFRAQWCSENEPELEPEIGEEFLKEIVKHLRNRVEQIHLPLLESSVLIRTLGTYLPKDIIDDLFSTENYPPPTGHHPCVWSSTDLLIKTICLFTEDLLAKTNENDLADYTKFEYLLVTYFHQVEVVERIKKKFKNSQFNHPFFHPKSLLHIIDLDHASKFKSSSAFQQWQVIQSDIDLQTLKNLLLRNGEGQVNAGAADTPVKCVGRSRPIPLTVDDLLVDEKHPVILPSTGLINQVSRRSTLKSLQIDEQESDDHQERRDSSTLQATLDRLPSGIQTIFEQMFDQNEIPDKIVEADFDLFDLIDNALAAVEQYDEKNQSSPDKTVQERLAEFYHHSGPDGIHLLDDALKSAKSQTKDRNKYIAIAVDIVQDRLNKHRKENRRKRTVHFGRTLETLLLATDENEESATPTDIGSTNVENQSKPTEHIELETKPKVSEIVKDNESIITKTPKHPDPGLTVAQMAVLLAGRQAALTLTQAQIEQLYVKQGKTFEQIQADVKTFVQTNGKPEKFQLTDEQIVRIAMAEKINLKQISEFQTSNQSFRLNSNQIRSLMTQIKTPEDPVSSSRSLTISLDQLQHIVAPERIDASADQSSSTFTLTSSQIAHLINQHQYDLEQLYTIEDRCRTEKKSNESFVFTSAQWAYLLGENATQEPPRSVNQELPVSQLVGLIALNEHTNRISRLKLSYAQIEQLAGQQDKSQDYLKSLPRSNEPLRLTDEQLIYLAHENQISLQHIIEMPVPSEESMPLDRSQVKNLIKANNRISDERFRLTMEQIHSLANDLRIDFEQEDASIEENVETNNFRFKPEQIAQLWTRDDRSVDVSQTSSSLFHLTDEQFSSLLGLVSSPTHAEEFQSESTPSPSTMIERTPSTESAKHQKIIPSIPSLTKQYYAVRNQLVSNIEKHIQATEEISNGILQQDLLDYSLDLIRQISLHAIDDLSTKDVQSIPSVVIDILKGDTTDQRIAELNEMQIEKIRNEFLTEKLRRAFENGELPKHLLDAMKSYSPLEMIQQVRASMTNQAVAQHPIILASESPVYREQIIDELRKTFDTQILRLNEYYNIEPVQGQPTLRQIAEQIRTMPFHVKLQSIWNRSIDEVDVLNILEGYSEYLLSPIQIDTKAKIDQHRQDRTDRIAQRLDLFNVLQNHLETHRLHRLLTTEELSALATENVEKFEGLTQVKLTETDLRILSMDRFASIERKIDRSLTPDEYRSLLQTSQPAKYLEDEILRRPLTIDEHIEQNELIDHLSGSDWQQILHQRAEIVDQYALIHQSSALFNRIENELNRYLSIDEKKRLVSDDYSILQRLKDPLILPITASVIEQVEITQDKDLMVHLKYLENLIGRPLTKQEIVAAIQADLETLEKSLGHSLPSDVIRRIYQNRLKDLEETLSRPLDDEEFVDVLKGKFTNVEKALRRSLTPAELLKLKSVNVIDLTASQITKAPSNEKLIEELADTLQRRLSSDEIEFLTDQPKRRTLEKIIINNDENLLIENQTRKSSLLTEPLHGLMFDEPLQFTLNDLEKVLGRRLTGDQLQTFLNHRADRIEQELGQPLTDIQRAHLLHGDHLTIESLLGRKLTSEEAGPHTSDLQSIEKILDRSLTLDEMKTLAKDRFDQVATILQRPFQYDELVDLLNGSVERMKALIEAELDRQKEQELKESLIKRIREFERILRRPLSSDELIRFAEHRFQPWSPSSLSANEILDVTSGHFESVLHRSIKPKELYQYNRNVLQSFLKDTDRLDEIELIVQRRLTYPELCRLAGNRFDAIERRLGRILTEEQLRHLLHGEDDSSLIEAKDLIDRTNEVYADDRQRTKRIAHRLLNELEMPFDDENNEEVLSTASLSNQSDESVPIKAFEPVHRRVEQVARRESIEDRDMLNEIFNRADTISKRSSITSDERQFDIATRPTSHLTRPKDDVYLGWTLFKGADEQQTGLRLERPRMIQVKHFAKLYVAGIPEEYVDEKSQILAHKIYRGDIFRPRLSKSRRPRTMKEYMSETFHLPLISDATHFIVPSRAYEDMIDTFENNESNMIDIEDQDFQRRDSPETIEWYEECLQRNIQIHAQIPFGHQPSILYCHTGRRLLISPAKRDEQRRASMMGINRNERRTSTIALSSLRTTNFPVNQSTSQRVMDLIMKTISRSEKSDLLEAIEELFSEANLERQFMEESDWQEVFLILLNSYLRSKSSNRKTIFKRLTDQLNQLRHNEHRKSTGTLPSISVTTPTDRTGQENDFGFRSSIDSFISPRTSNENLHLPPITHVNARNTSAYRHRIRVMQTEDSFLTDK